MKNSSPCYAGCLLLVATLIGRATCQQAQTPRFATGNSGGIASTPARALRNLQDVPEAGVGFGSTPAGDSSTVISGSGSSPMSTTSVVVEELVEALEQDDQVTGEISTRKGFLAVFLACPSPPLKSASNHASK